MANPTKGKTMHAAPHERGRYFAAITRTGLVVGVRRAM